MTYIIKLIGGDKIRITEDEYRKLEGETGLVYIPSCGESVNCASISHIVSEEKFWQDERQRSDLGVLHDGTRVKRQFGEWVCLEGDRDDHGRLSVKPDPRYYPEVARDCVASNEEWERVISLMPPADRLPYLLGTGTPERRIGGGMESIGKIAAQSLDKPTA